MDLPRRMSFFNILTFSIPLLCLLLSWASSTTTTFPPSPPPAGPPSSSILAAAETLRTRGYSLFSSALISTFSTTSSLNFSATILAAPDFLFAFSPNPTRRAVPRRPSATLLLYHTLQPPSLQWLNLTSLHDGDELRTLHNDYCLFLFKNPNGDVFISSSKKPIFAVNIRHPDLYVDDNLAVHGVDGVMDPFTGYKCSSVSVNDQSVEIQWVHRSFLDLAIRGLRRRGFHVAAAALAISRPDLLNLPAVTVFVPSDKALFLRPDGFRYDFRRHVVPRRLRFAKLMTSSSDGTEFETLASNKTVFLQSGSDGVSVNGVRLDGAELYHNRWIVLYSIPVTLDDVAAREFLGFNNWVPSSVKIDKNLSGDMLKYFSSEQASNAVPTGAPESSSELIGPPGPPPESHFLGPIESGFPGVPPVSGQNHVEDTEFAESPSPSSTPAMNDAARNQCGVVSTVTLGVDSADLFCPVNDVMNMQEKDDVVQAFPVPSPDVAQFNPSDFRHFHLSKKLLQSEPSFPDTSGTDEGKNGRQVSDNNGKQDPADLTNIAADLFYYT